MKIHNRVPASSSTEEGDTTSRYCTVAVVWHAVFTYIKYVKPAHKHPTGPSKSIDQRIVYTKTSNCRERVVCLPSQAKEQRGDRHGRLSHLSSCTAGFPPPPSCYERDLLLRLRHYCVTPVRSWRSCRGCTRVCSGLTRPRTRHTYSAIWESSLSLPTPINTHYTPSALCEKRLCLSPAYKLPPCEDAGAVGEIYTWVRDALPRW